MTDQTPRTPRTAAKILAAVSLVGALALAGCAASDPLAGDNGGGDASRDTIVIASQTYYSNEIIAEAYAQALEAAGYSVDRQYRIGQREVYLTEVENGAIDLIPEYSGNLLQYWVPDTEARLSDDVYAELAANTPKGLRVLDQSPATDQDAYMVTRKFADTWKLKTIADLKNVTVPLTLGSTSASEARPHGTAGLAEVYGIDGVAFTPIEDSGGPLTVKALKDGTVQFAIMYTADPSVLENGLVTLEDTKGVFLASHVVPLASDRVDAAAAKIVNDISAAMSPEDLVALGSQSVNEQRAAADIAAQWLTEKGLLR
ncbi:ABC transporter substrate-binding protein [Leucobacter insecticola]|uniref:ABC transporter substrate-binding protein n=1 Tax=Leucobacter insecticola TaxID=2714934 RepID=A0A6G8FHT5_9MICO|nr:ABC transporter substrate-binding protein [Leucobacter insecticola]QIM16056.1 ABC transporter substrate-binding protein [Leucobacter insecticola]